MLIGWDGSGPWLSPTLRKLESLWDNEQRLTISFTIGAILIAASYGLAQFIIGRIVLGVGVGGAAVIGPLYIAELAPTAVRGRCIGVNAFFIPFGQLIASALGAIFEAAVPYHIGWRVLCK